MGDLLIHGLSDEAVLALRDRARMRGVPPETIAREIVEAAAKLQPALDAAELPELTEDQRVERRRVAAEMQDIRARQLKPFSTDSVALIREDRDTR